MIDWGNLAANALWISGLSVALAAFSFAAWEAGSSKEKIAARLRRPGYRAALNLAALLVCLGLAGTASRLWGTALWLLLGAAFLAQTVIALRKK